MAELKGTLKVSNFLKGKLLPFGVSPGAVLYNKVQNLSEEEKARVYEWLKVRLQVVDLEIIFDNEERQAE
jgi:hypothetical protein